MLERFKTVHSLHRAATVTRNNLNLCTFFYMRRPVEWLPAVNRHCFFRSQAVCSVGRSFRPTYSLKSVCTGYLKRNPNYYTWTLHAQNDETNHNIEFLQPCPGVAADALLEIGSAVISAVVSLDEHLSQTDTSCVPKCCYQSMYCCLIRYFLTRKHIAKCFTNSSKRFRYEVMFVNERTFCS
jgi:hypothetical protein